ncbi:MAG: hypothetical protein H3Z53_02560 [archaeon]|nr:hypothetical protein [archaeon]MCP8313242.1 hypothetical protein [archaeon]MCP8319797.1 hypothetical protein [archaeon]
MSSISANVSDIKCDGENIPGLQSIEFKIMRSRENIYGIGSGERWAVNQGPIYVVGSLRVRSTYPKFDAILIKEQKEVTPFQLVVDLKSSAIGTKAWGQPVKTLTFDECYLEDKTFTLDANGIGISVYTFTSTRIREQ